MCIWCNLHITSGILRQVHGPYTWSLQLNNEVLVFRLIILHITGLRRDIFCAELVISTTYGLYKIGVILSDYAPGSNTDATHVVGAQLCQLSFVDARTLP